MTYTWDFGDGNMATTANATHSYAAPGTYIVKQTVTSDKGCIDTVSYTVHVWDDPVAGFTVDVKELCLKDNRFTFTNTSTIANGTMQYSWDMDDGNTVTTKDVIYRFLQPRIYNVRLLATSDKGCPKDSVYPVLVNPMPVASFSEPNNQQCFGNNLFNFTNNTGIVSGTMQYIWDLGDNSSAVTTNVTHSYTVPGQYHVSLAAISDKGCLDSTSMDVQVFKYAVADFAVTPVCTNLKLPIINRTFNTTSTNLNYLWDFGNGQTSTDKVPVYSYPVAGTYTIKLSVNTNFCPATVTEKSVVIQIEAPAPGIRYPDRQAYINYPEPLQARPIGNDALWTPATSLDFPRSYNPVFKGEFPQLYTIRLKTPTGCFTYDTLLVNTVKKIEIYVPQSFTPNGNGLNDYLKPVLYGMRSMTYFRVFNRWGRLLFETKNDRPGWDGRVKGDLLEAGTYVWMVEAIDVDGVKHQRQGTVILLR
jgi:gliding motility-associated-like protein